MKKLISLFKNLFLLICLVFLFSAGCFAADTSDNKNKISAAMQGVLFPHGMDSITPQHIRQGRFDDSQLIATVSSLANTKSGKKLIMSYFYSDHAQHVAVTLPKSYQSFDVVIADIENDKSYAFTLDGGLWLAVLEKAMALDASISERQYSAHDDFIDRVCSHTSDDSYYLSKVRGHSAMKRLTGSHVFTTFIDKISLKNLHEKLALHTTYGKVVTANSLCVSNHDKGEVTEIIRSCHTYSILGYDPDKKLVTLRNPYGEGAMLDVHTGEPLGEVDDGQFSLSLEQFKEYLESINFLETCKSTLFPYGMDSIRTDNIRQGRMPDCQLIAVISSLARTVPGRELIMNYFSSDNEQYVTVKLPGSPQSFDMPIADLKHSGRYASTLDGGLWPVAIEKAVVLHISTHFIMEKYEPYISHQDYIAYKHDRSDDSYYLQKVNSAYLIKLLTDIDAYKIPINDFDLKELHNKLTFYTDHSAIVIAGTSCAMNDDGGEITEVLLPCHAYSMLEYDPDKKLIALRDPQAQGARKPVGEAKDGKFSISLENLKEHFDNIFCSEPKQAD